MRNVDYDTWKLRSGQDKEVVVFTCDHCWGEVYKGEEFYQLVDGERVHEECFSDYAKIHYIEEHGIAGERL